MSFLKDLRAVLIQVAVQELKAFGLLYQDEKDIMPQFIWRETSVQHFDTPLGQPSTHILQLIKLV